MNEPARKRRKTASPDATDRSSSPLKQRPRRPSFASPTKASLARYNPNLLPVRPTTTISAPDRPASRGGILDRGKQALSFIFGSDDAVQPHVEAAQNVAEDHADSQGGDARGQRSPSISDRPRRSGLFGRLSRPLDEVNEEEPELPIHPSSVSLEEADTPRRGALFSSPSKRPARVRAGAKQQPTKQIVQPEQVQDPHVQVQIPRKRQPPDPELEDRKREKRRLDNEMQELENHIAKCVHEIEALQDQPDSPTFNLSEHNDLASFIGKICDSGPLDKSQNAQPISALLCSFLPFSANAVIPQSTKGTRDDVIPSHRALELDDPIPYLQMFTSFTFESYAELVLDDRSSENGNMKRKHVIDIAGPQKLLTSSIEAIIDSSTHEIVSLRIAQLSNHAERELGRFARQKAKENDLSTLSWAIGSFWELSKKRAEYWNRCEKQFLHLLPGHTSEDRENTSVTKRQSTNNTSRKTLRGSLGRDTLILQDKHVLLKLIWRIDFDWTGEACSEISIETAFPQVWSEADETKTFGTVSDTFHKLVESRGVFEATRIMVSLLFPER